MYVTHGLCRNKCVLAVGLEDQNVNSHVTYICSTYLHKNSFGQEVYLHKMRLKAPLILLDGCSQLSVVSQSRIAVNVHIKWIMAMSALSSNICNELLYFQNYNFCPKFHIKSCRKFRSCSSFYDRDKFEADISEYHPKNA